MKKGNKILEYLEKLTQADTNESSKRFVFIYLVLFLITYIVVRFTNKDNVELILAELIGFASALAYVASKHNNIFTKTEEDEKTNDRRDSQSDD